MSPQERRSSAREARTHLKKAEMYLVSATRAAENKEWDPAVSNAVISGINASDVVAIAAVGVRSDGRDHESKIGLLRRSGERGDRAAPLLARLLPMKNAAQYRAALASESEATAAIAAAEELLDLARSTVADLP